VECGAKRLELIVITSILKADLEILYVQICGMSVVCGYRRGAASLNTPACVLLLLLPTVESIAIKPKTALRQFYHTYR